MSKKRKHPKTNWYVVGAVLPISFFPVVIFILQNSRLGSFVPVTALPIGDDGFTFWSPELFRLTDGDRLLYDASMCRVHSIKMNRVVVPIAYGLYMPDRNYSRAEESAFPNAGVVLGGCCVDTERPSTHTWVCPTCLANKSRWEKQRKEQKTNG